MMFAIQVIHPAQPRCKYRVSWSVDHHGGELPPTLVSERELCSRLSDRERAESWLKSAVRWFPTCAVSIVELDLKMFYRGVVEQLQEDQIFELVNRVPDLEDYL